MHAQATAKMMRVSPRKVRLLLDEVRGRRVDEAMVTLDFSDMPIARDVKKVVKSAAANAENNLNMPARDLRVVACWAGPGPSLKRFKPRSRGRVSPILHRTSHVTVVVGDGRD